MEKFWINNIYRSIKDVSDIDYQEKSWFGGCDLVSSYDEVINILYNDNCFEDFIGNSFWNNPSIKIKNLHQDLILLNDMINNYSEPGSEKEIINDPNWHLIVYQAEKIIKEWYWKENVKE